MRILQVTHAFLPESTGGTETQTYLLAKALAERHEVAVCTHLSDAHRPEHELVCDTFDGLSVYRITNNFTWGSNAEYFFFDPGQDTPFEDILNRFQPDLVHFQHLGGGLSTSFPGLVHRRGIPSVLTLHDFWPLCYRSHLLTSDGQLCPGPEGGLRCARCWEMEQPMASLAERVREVGLRNALRMAPRYLASRAAAVISPAPNTYQVTRLVVRDQYFRDLLARFDRLFAPSRFLLASYIEWGVDPQRTFFVPNGVNPAAFTGLECSLPAGDYLAAAYIGSLLPYKGLDVLIEAFNDLRAVPIQLRIYGRIRGSASLEAYVRSLQERLTNPHVTFEGEFRNEDVGRILSKVDLVILPSVLYENCPMAILEAFYARRPVVASNVGGMAELVKDGLNGITFNIGDAKDLARVLQELATQPDQLQALQQGITPPPTISQVAAEYERHYRAVLEAQKGARCSST